MGAFFLFRNGIQLNEIATAGVFQKKGFAPPAIFELGNLTLWLYRKQLVNEPNYAINGKSKIFCTGTVIYQGLSYQDTLKKLLNDFEQSHLDLNALLGNFCLIFHVNGQINILTDRLCSHHVFMDGQGDRLSSSFLALLASFDRPQTLNRMAIYEKIATGHIVAPETLVSSIQQITLQMQVANQNGQFRFLTYPPDPEPAGLCNAGFDICVDQQLEVLLDYFRQIKPLALEYGTDLGLSGGYDSRLLLLLALECTIPISVHTHLKEQVHIREHQIAQQIASLSKVPIRVVKTKPIEAYDESQRTNILKDNLYFFDGRSTNNVGAFNETCTRAYTQQTSGGNLLGLNGKGGEIYRNYYQTARSKVNFLAWWQHHACYIFAEAALTGAKVWPDLCVHVLDKMSRRLDIALDGKVGFLTLRRYYGEIKAGECDSNINDAHNQLLFHLTPFIEYSVLKHGYAATPYIGLSNAFESAMLSRLNNRIAEVGSHYGFSLNHEPFLHKLLAALKGYLPDRFWLARKRYQIRHAGLGQANLEKFLVLCKDSPLVNDIVQTLRKFFPEVEWSMLMRDKTSQANVLYVGLFLLEFGSQLR
jgi:hypothetical protein